MEEHTKMIEGEEEIMLWMNFEASFEETILDFLDDQKKNEKFLSSEEAEVLSSTESSVTMKNNTEVPVPRAIYVKKRKYEKRENDLCPGLKRRRGAPAFYVVFPRILKTDIRRKYMLMYENVMNSFNYELISSFFQKFFVPNVSFEKKAAASMPGQLFFEGVKPVLSFFLLTLQMSPDKATRVFDVQLKQSAADFGKTEVSCRFTFQNTKMYETSIHALIQMLKNDLLDVLNDSSGVYPSARKIRKAADCVKIEDMDDHQLLFDPISGIFLKSKFARSESLVEYQVEGSMTFIVNEEKRIEKIIGEPFARHEKQC